MPLSINATWICIYHSFLSSVELYLIKVEFRVFECHCDDAGRVLHLQVRDQVPEGLSLVKNAIKCHVKITTFRQYSEDLRSGHLIDSPE